MVDDSGRLVATMVLLVHLGQLRTSYGPEHLQEFRSLTAILAQWIDNFSEFFFHLFGIDSMSVSDKKFVLKYVI